ncbi:hypothetical protein ON010_g2147 [Phytophthora cinnamomi]|nr:hypothetical protein ON010_g2147 [Phytophthora cinnamomi]
MGGTVGHISLGSRIPTTLERASILLGQAAEGYLLGHKAIVKNRMIDYSQSGRKIFGFARIHPTHNGITGVERKSPAVLIEGSYTLKHGPPPALPNTPKCAALLHAPGGVVYSLDVDAASKKTTDCPINFDSKPKKASSKVRLIHVLAMQAPLQATGSSATVWRWGPDYNPALQFTIVPPRDTKLRAEQLQTLREGLALFAAVGWINVALIYLLKSKGVCKVQEETRSHVFMMAELPVFVELEVTRKLSNDPSKDLSWVSEDLVALCYQLNEQNTSEEFQAAWAKIEVLYKEKSRSLKGLTIPVRVIIGKPEYTKNCGTASRTASQHVWNVIKDALDPGQVQWGWFSSLLGSRSTLARRSGSVFCASYVVNSINAKSSVTFNGTSAAFMKLLTEMSREVRFSALSLCLVPRRDSQNACRMISSLFCGNSRPNGVIDQRGVDYACVSFQDKSGLEMNALCSALAVTQACRSATFTLCSYGSASSVEVWMWMANAFFSNRARLRSSVKQVTIYNARLDRNILDTMSRILSASNTEQELFAVATGLDGSSNTAGDAHEYHLRENATIQVTEEAAGRVISWNSSVVAADEFVRACEQYNAQLCRLECQFHGIHAFEPALSNASNMLAGTLRWWHCDLGPMPRYMAYYGTLRYLVHVLAGSKVLHYLTVEADIDLVGTFKDTLTRFNLEELDGNGRLPGACKLAFLSVFHSVEAHSPLKKQAKYCPERLRLRAPDMHVISEIFELAATHAVRKVNVIAHPPN